MREITGDDETMAAWNGAWSEQENLETLERHIRGYDENGYGRWAVVLKETGKMMGKMIGNCGLMWWDIDTGRVLELGYMFNRNYWHHGYATEAAIACKKYAFDVVGIDEVFSIVRDDNFSSMNVAIRNGMLVRRRYMKQYKGESQPHYLFSARRTV